MDATTVGEHAYSDLFGGFALWPEGLHWSFQFVRLVSSAPVGGADFTEVFLALRDVRAGDIDAWHTRLWGLAADLDERAERALAGGHRASARGKWLRASNYYRAAGFFHDLGDEVWLDTTAARRRCFQAAGALARPPIVPVEVPYEGGASLPGYLVPALAPGPTARPAPAAVVFGGGDAMSEEMYFHIGRPLAERGFTVLLVDGPGMGEALRRGLVARHDWEVPTAAALDFLLERDDVDAERVALIAESLGGYYAARGAAFEPRVKACVVWGGPYSVPLQLLTPVTPGGPLPADGRPARRLISLTGAADAEDARQTLSKFTLEGVAERIHCPTLVLVAGAETGFLRRDGEGDGYEPVVSPGQRILNEIPHDKKELIEYPIGTPGCAHCQADSMVQAHDDICDWLETTLATTGA